MKSIILAGGSGTRLWPLSRELYPKQFIKLLSESLFQKTLKRAILFSHPEDIFIVTNEKQKFLVLDQIAEMKIKIPKENVIIEPIARNTLPAIYYAVLKIAESGHSIVSVFPSDHVIAINSNYKSVFKKAVDLADKYIVTFGIKPNKPHTGYGYIKPGEKINGGFKVEKFVEKPDKHKAKEFIEKGYLWNSGMLLFNTKIFIEECKRLASEIVEAFENGGDLAEIYSSLPNISVDYGLLEKSNKVAVVKLDVNWNDVGSFDALYEIMKKDSSKNAIKGNCIVIDSKNNLLYSERLLAAIGLEELIVVDTRDAILICSRKDAQKVKEVVRILKNIGDSRAESHTIVYKPWGSYTVLEENQFYKIKRITVLPKKRLSLQMHYHRSEHWVVVKGTAKVQVGDKEFLLRSGESAFVPAGVKHRLENPGLVPLEVIEVQIGEYLSEDDIIRIEDDFGRLQS